MKGLVINWKDLSFVNEGFLKASVRSKMSLVRFLFLLLVYKENLFFMCK